MVTQQGSLRTKGVATNVALFSEDGSLGKAREIRCRKSPEGPGNGGTNTSQLKRPPAKYRELDAWTSKKALGISTRLEQWMYQEKIQM